jgi:hypothetical protein
VKRAQRIMTIPRYLESSRIRVLVCALLLPLCSPPVVSAQEKPALLGQIERAFKKKAQGWKVERIDAKNRSDPAAEDIFLRSGGKTAKIAISIWKRAKDAHDVFEAFAGLGTRPEGVQRETIKDFGDENYTWTSPRSSGQRSLTFRRANILVIILAPSIVIAKQFARRILDEIEAEAVVNNSKSEQ